MRYYRCKCGGELSAPGLKHEVLQCAKDKIDAARTAKIKGQYAEAIRLADEASDLSDLVLGWMHLDALLEESKLHVRYVVKEPK